MKKFLGLILIIFITACAKKAPGPDSGGGGGGTSDDNAPGVAVLTTPLKDQPCLTGIALGDGTSTVSFSWENSTNTDSYDLVIKNLLTQTSVTIPVTTNQATATLLENTPYAWYVNSKYSKSTTVTASDTWKFYNSGPGIITYAPFPAEIIAPTFGQILSATKKVNLQWKGGAIDDNIASYTVYFGPKSNPDLYKTQITDPFINGITVSTNTTYYWRVVTIDANGNYSDSGLFNFFIKK